MQVTISVNEDKHTGLVYVTKTEHHTCQTKEVAWKMVASLVAEEQSGATEVIETTENA